MAQSHKLADEVIATYNQTLEEAKN